MEVRPGYKLTEVGPIPEEWNVHCLAELCSKITDGTHDTPTPVRSGRPFLTAIHIRENAIDFGNCLYLDETDHRTIFARCNPQRGDVLMVNIGAGVATTALVDVDFEFSLKNVALLKPVLARASGRFLNQSLIARKASITQALSSGGAQPFLSLTEIGQIRIPAPPKSEQEAIADALSDVDALLGGLDRLITKKRDLKQAAMQQLLTGQTHLPGFSGAWEVKRLDEIAEIVSGGTPKTSEPAYWNGGIKWCTPTDITGCTGKYLIETERTISRLGLQSSGARLLPAGALLLCSRATIGEVKIASGTICTNQGFKSLVCMPGESNEFLYYTLLTMKQKMVERAFGSTFLEISKANVAALEVNTPSFPEQTAIAAVLSDMDAELSALEARRDKTRALKQAMMQELLTGRIRLV